MEYKEAKEITSKFKEAISSLEYDASRFYRIEKYYEEIKDKNKELQKELQEANKFKRYFNLISTTSKCEICHQCDGNGGFEYDMGEQGGASEMCENCQGTGVVDKPL